MCAVIHAHFFLPMKLSARGQLPSKPAAARAMESGQSRNHIHNIFQKCELLFSDLKPSQSHKWETAAAMNQGLRSKEHSFSYTETLNERRWFCSGCGVLLT